jgi:putative multiple sugar transport system permease protein
MTTETAPLPSEVPTPVSAGLSGRSILQANLRDYGLVVALLAIMVFFQIFTAGTMFKPVNLTNLVLQNSYIVIMALGMLLVIVAGHIDLSVGSVSGFIGAIAAILMVQYHVPAIPAGLLWLFHRLYAGAIVHRDVGGHAGVQGPVAGSARRQVGGSVPHRVPAAQRRLYS